MSKQLVIGQEAKDKLLSGIKQLSDAVGATLSPLGDNVAIDREWAAPIVLHDGVSVAREIFLDDPYENMGAQLVKEAASKTNDVTGDGTTTSTILAYYLTAEGMAKISSGVKAMRLRRGMQKALAVMLEQLAKNAKPISTKEEAQQIATISAQDENIGKLVAEAVDKVGKDGAVHVEEGNNTKIELDYREGLDFDRGWASPYFVTNEAMEAVINNPFVLVTDRRLSSVQEIMPLLENVVKSGNPNLVIIADDIVGDALTALVVNKAKGNVAALAVRAPEFGDKRRAILEDIAAVTGAKFITEASGQIFSSVGIESLGKARKIVSTADTTLIVGGQGKPEEQVKKIKLAQENAKNDFEKEALRERLAKLTTGVAVISVGANTEVEMKELKERVIDAVSATKAALQEGVLPGGGTALIHISASLKALKLEEEEQAGVDVVESAIRKPFMVLMENAGLDYLSMLKTVEGLPFGQGIDVMDGKTKDMMQAGIIDPAKVVRSALENAVSVASSILTTRVLIAEKKEDKKDA